MKIADAKISMQSQHSSLSVYTRTESLRVWKGNNGNAGGGGGGGTSGASATPNRNPSNPANSVSLSARARAAQAADSGDGRQLDPRLKMLIAMVEAITGKRVRIFDASELGQGNATSAAPTAGDSANANANTAANADFGLAYDYHESYAEAEQTTVSASGTIKTGDGKEIQFTLDLSMSRSYAQSTDISVRAGNAARKDPLVINFGGTAAQLSDQKFSFDLDGDGDKEDIAQFASASGYLALDKNGDGQVNDGTELLGPASDDGFSELAALDGDKNGWIDENDAAFGKLKVWVPGADGKDGSGQLMSLKDAGIGALALAHVNSKFELRGQGNSDLGGVRDTGLFLFENGGVGSLQEIDLSV